MAVSNEPDFNEVFFYVYGALPLPGAYDISLENLTLDSNLQDKSTPYDLNRFIGYPIVPYETGFRMTGITEGNLYTNILYSVDINTLPNLSNYSKLKVYSPQSGQTFATEPTTYLSGSKQQVMFFTNQYYNINFSSNTHLYKLMGWNTADEVWENVQPIDGTYQSVSIPSNYTSNNSGLTTAMNSYYPPFDYSSVNITKSIPSISSTFNVSNSQLVITPHEIHINFDQTSTDIAHVQAIHGAENVDQVVETVSGQYLSSIYLSSNVQDYIKTYPNGDTNIRLDLRKIDTSDRVSHSSVNYSSTPPAWNVINLTMNEANPPFTNGGGDFDTMNKYFPLTYSNIKAGTGAYIFHMPTPTTYDLVGSDIASGVGVQTTAAVVRTTSPQTYYFSIFSRNSQYVYSAPLHIQANVPALLGQLSGLTSYWDYNNNKMVIGWNYNPDAVSYRISSSVDGGTLRIDNTNTDYFSVPANRSASSQTMDYGVSPYDGEFGPNVTGSNTIPALLGAPSTLNVTYSYVDDTVDLVWSAVTGATRYLYHDVNVYKGYTTHPTTGSYFSKARTLYTQSLSAKVIPWDGASGSAKVTSYSIDPKCDVLSSFSIDYDYVSEWIVLTWNSSSTGATPSSYKYYGSGQGLTTTTAKQTFWGYERPASNENAVTVWGYAATVDMHGIVGSYKSGSFTIQPSVAWTDTLLATFNKSTQRNTVNLPNKELDGFTSYKLYYQIETGGTKTYVGTLSDTSFPYEHSFTFQRSIYGGDRIFYELRAVDTQGGLTDPITAVALVANLLSPPLSAAGSHSSSTYSMSWDPVPGATGYKVEVWKTSAGGSTYSIAATYYPTGTSQTYTISASTSGDIKIKFKVWAGDGQYSATYTESNITTIAQVAAAPGTPTVENVLWSAIGNNVNIILAGAVTGATSYSYYGGYTSNPTTLLGSTSSLNYSYGITPGTVDKTFYARAKACNEGGCSAYGTQGSVVIPGITCLYELTTVELKNGEIKHIKNLQVGDELRGLDLVNRIDESDPNWVNWRGTYEGSTISYPKVKSKLLVEVADYVVINNLKMTKQHTVIAKKNGDSDWGWYQANNLEIGDLLLGENNEELSIYNKEYIDEPIIVVKLDVEDIDNYYAGGILNHNIKIPTLK